MNKHTLISACGIAAVLAALALAGGSFARGASTKTLRLTITATKISDVDVPPLVTSKASPETAGDEVIAVSRVRGAATGRRYLVCTATQTAPSIETALYSCHVTYVLAGGTITADGVVRLDGSSTAAVTGGTGVFAAAHGTLIAGPGVDILRLD